jgi:septum site-determining protein MinC
VDSNHQPKHSSKNGAVNRAELSPAVEPDTNGHTGPKSPRTEDADGEPADVGLAVESPHEQEAVTSDESVDEVVEEGEDATPVSREEMASPSAEAKADEDDRADEDEADTDGTEAEGEIDGRIDNKGDEAAELATVAGPGTETGDGVVEGEAGTDSAPDVATEIDTENTIENNTGNNAEIEAGTSVELTIEATGETTDVPASDLAESESIEAARVAEAEDESNDTPLADDTPVAEDVAPAERSALVMNAVKIRGRPGGVAIEIAEGEWAELLAVLQERLDMAEGFFRGGRVVLDLGERPVDGAELQQVAEILAGFGMEMAVVRAEAESTLEAAVALGITTSSGEGDDPLRGITVSSGEAQAEEESAQGPVYYVHQGNLRSGQVLQRAESVIVIGDVNPGAQVISNGDVLIWGRLRGSVHAGAEGDSEAMVTAMEFAPTQLRIAGLTSVPPEEQTQSRNFLFWKKNDVRSAEFAYVSDGRIYVEPWNAAKPGSLTARRRQ